MRRQHAVCSACNVAWWHSCINGRPLRKISVWQSSSWPWTASFVTYLPSFDCGCRGGELWASPPSPPSPLPPSWPQSPALPSVATCGTPSVKKHERVTAISWAHCGLRRSFLVLWTLHNYEKNHLWPFEARADFSVSLSLSLSLRSLSRVTSVRAPRRPGIRRVSAVP